MTLKNFYEREVHVAMNAQPRNFRIIKWITIVILGSELYAWKGLAVVGTVLLACGALGVCLHFFLRWKTEAWTKSWGPYKRIPLNDE